MSRLKRFEHIYTTHRTASKYSFIQIGVLNKKGLLRKDPPWLKPSTRRRENVLEFLEDLREQVG